MYLLAFLYILSNIGSRTGRKGAKLQQNLWPKTGAHAVVGVTEIRKIIPVIKYISKTGWVLVELGDPRVLWANWKTFSEKDASGPLISIFKKFF